MAKKKTKEETKFSKWLPGESTWKGRKDKTKQDRLPAGQRDRVHEAQDRRKAMQKS